MTVVRNNAPKVKLSGITALVETLKSVDTKSVQAKFNKEHMIDGSGRVISYKVTRNKSKPSQERSH